MSNLPARASRTLGEIAVRFGLELVGDPDLRVDHVAGLESAGQGAVSFLANSRFRRYLKSTRATAVVVSPADAVGTPAAALIHANPYAAYARIATLLYPAAVEPAGVHPSAVIAPGASIDPSATIGPLCVVEEEVQIGAGARIGPGCIIQRGAVIGAHTRLVAHVTVRGPVRIGQRCILHPGSVIGADGFGFAPDRPAWVKVPQLGGVVLGDDVDIGCNTTIDRGAIGDTEIGDGVKLDNQIQIGHNVKVGEHTIMAACTGISGSTVIGKRCILGGMIGMAGHIQIGDDVMITGQTSVTGSLDGPGAYSATMPAMPARRWRRLVARFHRLEPDRRASNETQDRSDDE
ncbi:MAG: UDP-3-O-(3-hydroxymyristoyl)glucosamine N-acyltransferase [Steroidobacteraceae bacterium]